ncbi:hypothetical protein [Pasteuria penetrans]|uniref:hypothetical protein n=1 Tax=Pasteuria penetrans TaxID=86005 RepID=UPI0011EBF5F2|nr:hypothetical protein [Pasteuria penetrans]
MGSDRRRGKGADGTWGTFSLPMIGGIAFVFMGWVCHGFWGQRVGVFRDGFLFFPNMFSGIAIPGGVLFFAIFLMGGGLVNYDIT